MTPRSSLEERFTRFLKSLPGTEPIDDLLSPGEHGDQRRADFLIKNREVIIELKTLKSDTAPKVEREISKHRDRPDFPLIYGKVGVESALKHLSDGDQIKRKIYLNITRSIEDAIRSAEEQIASTRKLFGISKSAGLLVMLNDSIDILDPHVVGQRAMSLIHRKDISSEKQNSVNFAWLMFESHKIARSHGEIQFPSLVLEGRNYTGFPWFDSYMDTLQRGWAEFNSARLEYSDAMLTELSFESVALEEVIAQVPKTKQDYWEMKYRAAPYMRTLNDDQVLAQGAAVFKKLVPYLLKGGPRISPVQMEQLLIAWSDFLQEARFRGLNLQNFHTK